MSTNVSVPRKLSLEGRGGWGCNGSVVDGVSTNWTSRKTYMCVTNQLIERVRIDGLLMALNKVTRPTGTLGTPLLGSLNLNKQDKNTHKPCMSNYRLM